MMCDDLRENVSNLTFNFYEIKKMSSSCKFPNTKDFNSNLHYSLGFFPAVTIILGNDLQKYKGRGWYIILVHGTEACIIRQ